MMKIKSILLMLFTAIHISYCQVPSSCVVPSQLYNMYEKEIKTMTLRRMFQMNVPDTAFVRISPSYITPTAKGLAAIFNATSIPERDSVFNIYCVHDTSSYLTTYNSIRIQVDTNYAWTDAWQNLDALTGNAYIDHIMITYNLRVIDFYNSIYSGSWATLYTDSIWNVYALIDTFQQALGVTSGDVNGYVGVAGFIDYKVMAGNLYYDFYFQFNDCFNFGCSNYRKWRFRVHPDCSVDYLGFEDVGYPGNEFPPPLNCCTFCPAGINESEKNLYKVYPNPAENHLVIQSPDFIHDESAIYMYDIMGKQVLTATILADSEQIDVSHLSNGIYILIIDHKGNSKEVHKLIKK